MTTAYQEIRRTIEQLLDAGKREFIIYPYGEYGMITKKILNDSFGITEAFIVDNKLSKYNSNILSLDSCKNFNKEQYIVLFTCANLEIKEEVRREVEQYFSKNNIIEIFQGGGGERYTKCGKYSYGPLCNHWLVESVGAFCSFAPGSDVVENHAIDYLSTSPFLYYGSEMNDVHTKKYSEYKLSGRFPGVIPKGSAHKLKKISIGNDVWLGKNVTITNSANIGNGVIAGAGAVITKDIPDYAVVVGVPARIIRYRYTKEQIETLNKIAWWNWTDEKIRECFDDFYLEIEKFIKKHK